MDLNGRGDRYADTGGYYDPFGKREILDCNYNQASYSPASPLDNSVLQRGFTGHEHYQEDVDDYGIINMNGRIYDPKLGRMMQADPIISSAYNAQSINRYSYVLNNPLIHTDPSGYKTRLQQFGGWLNGNKATLAGIAFSVALAGTDGGAFATFMGGFGGGLIASNGNLKAGVVGGSSAYAFHWVGHGSGLKGAGKLIGHAAVGGATAAANGGKFWAGVFSAGVMQGLSLMQDNGVGWLPAKSNRFGNVVVAAAVGAGSARLAGGDWRQGAYIAVYSRFFNDLGRKLRMEARRNRGSTQLPDLEKGVYAVVARGVSFIVPARHFGIEAGDLYVIDPFGEQVLHFIFGGIGPSGGIGGLLFNEYGVIYVNNSSEIAGFGASFESDGVAFGLGGTGTISNPLPLSFPPPIDPSISDGVGIGGMVGIGGIITYTKFQKSYTFDELPPASLYP